MKSTRQSPVLNQLVKITFHKFLLGDVEDPDLYAAVPIGDWLKTEQGAWCKENVVGEMKYYIQHDYATYGYSVAIVGMLAGADNTYFQLKWGNSK